MNNHNGVYTSGLRNRRVRALGRLEAQLKSGMKPALKPARGIDVPLDEDDVKRINKEISILKSKI